MDGEGDEPGIMPQGAIEPSLIGGLGWGCEGAGEKHGEDED
jgi:hypothetical protein